MTIQNLFTADLADIIGVHLECGECGARAVYNPDGRTDISSGCPQCREMWNDPRFGNQEISSVIAFLDALKRLREKREKPARVSVKLAYDLGKK